jgi:hypothetical protein
VTLGDIASAIAKLNTNTIPDGLTLIDSKSQSDSEDLDQQFEDSNKKQRNLMSHLDHLYERISHPFTIVLIFIVIFIAFIVFRYLEIYHSSPLFSQISNDAGRALTYIITVVATSIFTKFFEGRRK